MEMYAMREQVKQAEFAEPIENKILNFKIDKFFMNDILDFREYPDSEISEMLKKSTKYSILDLSELRPILKKEIKAFIKNDLTRMDKKYSIIVPNVLRPLYWAIGYFKKLDKDSILKYSSEDIELYEAYFRKNVKTKPSRVDIPVLDKLQCFTIMYNERLEKDIFKRNIWEVSALNLSPERVNQTADMCSLNFYKIDNEENRGYAKDYIKAQICLKEKSYSSIYQEFRCIVMFCKFLGEASIKDTTREHGLEYIDHLEELELTPSAFNVRIQYVMSFYNYLSKKEIINSLIFNDKDFKKTNYEVKEIAVDDYVLFQMFNHIKDLPEKLLNMYLINVCTGIRISEVCSLKVDCLRKENDCCLLKFYSIKMRKDCYILIPDKLYEHLRTWQEKVINLDPNAIFLFAKESDPIKPYLTSTYSENMRNFIKKWGITNQDGTAYNFRSHAYRHSLAKDLIESDVPIFLVSQALNHSSLQMTLAYAEVRESQRKKKFAKFLDCHTMSQSEIDTEWLRENINKQALSNGFCCLPCKMKCPHYNNCLHCDQFVTSIDFLETHQTQLNHLKEALKESESKNWLTRIATLKKDIDKLEEIIKELRKEEN